MDMTTIYDLVIATVGAVVTAFVIPYIKSRTTAAQREQINALIKTAVLAAEQTITGESKGGERKNYVLAWLRTNGVTISAAKLDAMVESAVYKMKKGVL